MLHLFQIVVATLAADEFAVPFLASCRVFALLLQVAVAMLLLLRLAVAMLLQFLTVAALALHADDFHYSIAFVAIESHVIAQVAQLALDATMAATHHARTLVRIVAVLLQ